MSVAAAERDPALVAESASALASAVASDLQVAELARVSAAPAEWVAAWAVKPPCHRCCCNLPAAVTRLKGRTMRQARVTRTSSFLYISPSISVKKRLVTARSRDITEFFDFYSTPSMEMYGAPLGRIVACLRNKSASKAALVWLRAV